MRGLLAVKHWVKPDSIKLSLLVLLVCGSGVLLAASTIGLPYTLVMPDRIEDRHWDQDVEISAETVTALEEGDVEIAAEPVLEPVMLEVAPDSFNRRYRSGIDVYKNMTEHGFDDEPMAVIYAKADPAMALPEVVVVPASKDSNYSHITAAEAIADQIARGEDKIYLSIDALPVESGAAASGKPEQRRFFTEPLR